MQIKEEYVPTRVRKTYYVAIDGAKFTNKLDCEIHENEYINRQKMPVFKTAIHNIYDPYNDCLVSLYNIQSLEDWKMLVECEWYNNQDIKEYPGAGQYIAICHNGGDYDDDYTIVPAESYINNVMDEIYDFYMQVYSHIKKFKGEANENLC